MGIVCTVWGVSGLWGCAWEAYGVGFGAHGGPAPLDTHPRRVRCPPDAGVRLRHSPLPVVAVLPASALVGVCTLWEALWRVVSDDAFCA